MARLDLVNNRCVENPSSPLCADLLNKPVAAFDPTTFSFASPSDISTLPTSSNDVSLLPDSRRARQAYEDLLEDLDVAASSNVDEKFSLQNKTASLVAELDTLDHNLVSRLPGEQSRLSNFCCNLSVTWQAATLWSCPLPPR